MRVLIHLIQEAGIALAVIRRHRHTCPHRCGYRTRTPARLPVHLYIDHYGEPLP